MIEVRFHGRGGQGTVVASIILAQACFRAGFYVQSFPLFGVERRGAPVEAYLRLDRENIRVRTNVYTPDYVVVQDQKLLSLLDVTRGLRSRGWILVNWAAPPPDMSAFKGYRVAWLDAAAIAVANRLGNRTHPMINTAMAGAFARIFEEVTIDQVKAAIAEEITVKPEQNARAARQAYETVQILGLVS